MIKFKNILALSPHIDDIELGCGGYISKLIGEGATVDCVVFSTALKSQESSFDENDLKNESFASLKTLGILEKNIDILNYEVRVFNENRQHILDELIKKSLEKTYDLILIPSLNDKHQDHEVVATEAFRAFKKSSIFSYQLPWNQQYISTMFIVSLSSDNVNSKINALKCYNSQNQKKYFSYDFLLSQLKYNAIQGDDQIKYAELFEVVKLMDK